MLFVKLCKFNGLLPFHAGNKFPEVGKRKTEKCKKSQDLDTI